MCIISQVTYSKPFSVRSVDEYKEEFKQCLEIKLEERIDCLDNLSANLAMYFWKFGDNKDEDRQVELKRIGKLLQELDNARKVYKWILKSSISDEENVFKGKPGGKTISTTKSWNF